MSRDRMEILQRIADRGHQHVRLGGFDIDGLLRGKYVALDKFEGALESGLGFCDVIFGWDIEDALYEGVDVKYTGWHTGYPDAHAKIELETFRWVPWEDGTPFALFDFYTPEGEPLTVSPRQVLRQVVARAESMGYKPLFASEYEFFLFQESPHSIHDKGFRDLRNLTPAMCGYSALRASAHSDLLRNLLRSLREFDIPIEGIHTETGPGVYEVAIQYGPAVASADRAALAKTAIKELCARQGITAGFMAKWNEKLPGCSGHTHQSLWDLGGRSNLFFDANEEGNRSELFRWYLGGLLATMADFTVLYCPTINSYKRIVPGYWAPTRACWGIENRTTTLRVIPGTSPKHMRVENRIVGSDANPYLGYAASLAAGLYGIENRIEPPAALTGNAYEAPAAVAPSVPSSLEHATQRFRESDVARQCFGDAFVDHFAATRDWEVQQFRKAVTDWELKRYFELI